MNDAYTVVHAALRELYGHQNPEKWAVAGDAIESLGQLVAAARSEGYAQAKEQAAQEAMGGEFPAHLMCDHLKCEGAREAAQRIRAMEPKP